MEKSTNPYPSTYATAENLGISAPEWMTPLQETTQYLFRLDHHEQVDFFNELRAIILTERDKRIACIRSEIEAGQKRIDEILKGQEIIARIS